ncbi:hypothetical protein D3C71_1162100 [compost metagenome]
MQLDPTRNHIVGLRNWALENRCVGLVANELHEGVERGEEQLVILAFLFAQRCLLHDTLSLVLLIDVLAPGATL